MQSITAIMKLCRALYIMLFHSSKHVHMHFLMGDSQPAFEMGREGLIIPVHQGKEG